MTAKEKEVLCHLHPQVTLFSHSSFVFVLCWHSKVTALGWCTSVCEGAGLCDDVNKIHNTQNGSADVMGEKAKHDTDA